MLTYNVIATVVELVDAESPEAAKQELARRLRTSGFEVYEGAPADAFESER